MKLVVGLGNPTPEYLATRHNAGAVAVDELQKFSLPKDVVVKKSSVFMNESGEFVEKLVKEYKTAMVDLYVVHDDLDIPLGSYKIQFGRGPKDHNGLKSIDDRLGTSTYWHVRIGIDSRPLDHRPLGEEFVLQNFTDEERQVLDKVIKQLCKKLATSLQSIN